MSRAAAVKVQTPAPEASSVSIPRRRLLRSKGPLGPYEMEIVIYAGLAAGQLAETPNNLAIKTKAIAHLATDRPGLASAIAHKRLLQSEDAVAAANEVNRLPMQPSYRANPMERETAVAGSLELIDAVLPDAFRVLLFTNEQKPEIPKMFEGWKVSKPDNRSTPPVITLTRD